MLTHRTLPMGRLSGALSCVWDADDVHNAEASVTAASQKAAQGMVDNIARGEMTACRATMTAAVGGLGVTGGSTQTNPLTDDPGVAMF